MVEATEYGNFGTGRWGVQRNYLPTAVGDWVLAETWSRICMVQLEQTVRTEMMRDPLSLQERAHAAIEARIEEARRRESGERLEHLARAMCELEGGIRDGMENSWEREFRVVALGARAELEAIQLAARIVEAVEDEEVVGPNSEQTADLEISGTPEATPFTAALNVSFNSEPAGVEEVPLCATPGMGCLPLVEVTADLVASAEAPVVEAAAVVAAPPRAEGLGELGVVALLAWVNEGHPDGRVELVGPPLAQVTRQEAARRAGIEASTFVEWAHILEDRFKAMSRAFACSSAMAVAREAEPSPVLVSVRRTLEEVRLALLSCDRKVPAVPAWRVRNPDGTRADGVSDDPKIQTQLLVQVVQMTGGFNTPKSFTHADDTLYSSNGWKGVENVVAYSDGVLHATPEQKACLDVLRFLQQCWREGCLGASTVPVAGRTVSVGTETVSLFHKMTELEFLGMAFPPDQWPGPTSQGWGFVTPRVHRTIVRALDPASVALFATLAASTSHATVYPFPGPGGFTSQHLRSGTVGMSMTGHGRWIPYLTPHACAHGLQCQGIGDGPKVWVMPTRKELEQANVGDYVVAPRWRSSSYVVKSGKDSVSYTRTHVDALSVTVVRDGSPGVMVEVQVAMGFLEQQDVCEEVSARQDDEGIPLSLVRLLAKPRVQTCGSLVTADGARPWVNAQMAHAASTAVAFGDKEALAKMGNSLGVAVVVRGSAAVPKEHSPAYAQVMHAVARLFTAGQHDKAAHAVLMEQREGRRNPLDDAVRVRGGAWGALWQRWSDWKSRAAVARMTALWGDSAWQATKSAAATFAINGGYTVGGLLARGIGAASAYAAAVYLPVMWHHLYRVYYPLRVFGPYITRGSGYAEAPARWLGGVLGRAATAQPWFSVLGRVISGAAPLHPAVPVGNALSVAGAVEAVGRALRAAPMDSQLLGIAAATAVIVPDVLAGAVIALVGSVVAHAVASNLCAMFGVLMFVGGTPPATATELTDRLMAFGQKAALSMGPLIEEKFKRQGKRPLWKKFLVGALFGFAEQRLYSGVAGMAKDWRAYCARAMLHGVLTVLPVEVGVWAHMLWNQAANAGWRPAWLTQ